MCPIGTVLGARFITRKCSHKMLIGVTVLLYFIKILSGSHNCRYIKLFKYYVQNNERSLSVYKDIRLLPTSIFAVYIDIENRHEHKLK